MAIKVSSRKAKGRNLQQWVCKRISDILGIPWGAEDDKEIQSRPMGQSGTDVILRGKARELFEFDVECKSQETWKMNEFIEQAKSNSSRNWLLVLKKKNKKPVVVLDASVFFSLMHIVIFYKKREKQLSQIWEEFYNDTVPKNK